MYENDLYGDNPKPSTEITEITTYESNDPNTKVVKFSSTMKLSNITKSGYLSLADAVEMAIQDTFIKDAIHRGGLLGYVNYLPHDGAPAKVSDLTEAAFVTTELSIESIDGQKYLLASMRTLDTNQGKMLTESILNDPYFISNKTKIGIRGLGIKDADHKINTLRIQSIDLII